MLIYYINMDRRADRREFMEQQLEQLGLTATRIPARTPEQLTPDDIAAYCDPRRLRWQTPEEFSCSMSHVAAMTALLATSEDYALILEDDAILSLSLPAFIWAHDTAPPGIDLLRLETSHKRLTLARDDLPSLAGIAFCRNSGWEAGGAAYIVSRRAAEILVRSERMKLRQCDLAMFDPSERIARQAIVRQADPALAVQAQHARHGDVNLPSDLGASKSWVAGDAAFPWQRRLRRLLYVLDRDIFVAARKAWHRFAHGAERRSISFKNK